MCGKWQPVVLREGGACQAPVKEGGTPSHAPVPFSSISPFIAIQPPPMHAQLSRLSGTVLESPQLEGSVEKRSLNHAAMWAEFGGPAGHTKAGKEERGQDKRQQNQQGHPHTTTTHCSCTGGLAKGQALLVLLRHRLRHKLCTLCESQGTGLLGGGPWKQK